MAYFGFHGESEPTISIDLKNIETAKEEFKLILERLQPTNESTTIGTATDKYYEILNTPFQLGIDNPPVTNNVQSFALTVNYNSNQYSIRIKLPIDAIRGGELKFVECAKRKVYESEYHYFIGERISELMRKQLTCYKFTAKSMGWYGGNQTLLSEAEISYIIDHLTA